MGGVRLEFQEHELDQVPEDVGVGAQHAHEGRDGLGLERRARDLGMG